MTLPVQGQGARVISLSVGEPGFPPPPQVAAKTAAYILEKKGRLTYTAAHGIPELRRAVADKVRLRTGVAYDPEREVMITVGGKHGISGALLALANPGARVLIPSPLLALLSTHDHHRRRRQMAVDRLQGLPGLGVYPPAGAFYIMLDVRAFLGKPVGSSGQPVASDKEMAWRLLDEEHIAVAAASPFGAPSFLRISFAVPDTDLLEGIDRLTRLLHLT